VEDSATETTELLGQGVSYPREPVLFPQVKNEKFGGKQQNDSIDDNMVVVVVVVVVMGGNASDSTKEVVKRLLRRRFLRLVGMEIVKESDCLFAMETRSEMESRSCVLAVVVGHHHVDSCVGVQERRCCDVQEAPGTLYQHPVLAGSSSNCSLLPCAADLFLEPPQLQ
jgi:hypothetical protein